jgi:hypothetical protein
MTTRITSRRKAHANTDHLRRGAEYRATTRMGDTTGEYIGMESPYGDRAILLRNAGGTASIDLTDLTAIRRIA